MVAMFVCHFFVIFFFKQKTAYELRISDWSSDVCSSDLTDIDDPIARLRCDKLQQVASPPFLAGHERDCGVIAVERTALAKRGYEISVGVGHDPSLTAAIASALERRGDRKSTRLNSIH